MGIETIASKVPKGLAQVKRGDFIKLIPALAVTFSLKKVAATSINFRGLKVRGFLKFTRSFASF